MTRVGSPAALHLMAEGSRMCEKAGWMIIQDMKRKGVDVSPLEESVNLGVRSGRLREIYSDIGAPDTRFKEVDYLDLAKGAALYTTALASVIRAATEPRMVALQLLQMNTDLMGNGKGALKLPKELRVTAATVAEGGVISYTGIGYDSITVTAYKRISASKITWEMLKRGMVSLITAEAARCGKALARKVDSDILAAIEASVTAGNANRTATGGASTRVSYANLIDTRALLEASDYYFEPTHLVVHPDDYAALMKDTDFKNALYRAPFNEKAPGVGLFPQVEWFGPQKLVVTPQVTSGTSLFVDANELGTFCKETDPEVVDGRVSGSVDTEVIALQSYGIGIQNVRAVAGVIMAAS